MMRSVKFACWTLILVVFSLPAVAQNIATADLRGTVKDPGGAVVPGATVTVRDVERGAERTATTNPEGEFLFSLLPPGKYVVTVNAAGFGKYSTKELALTVGQSAELPVDLKVASGETEVTVTADAELVETQRSSATTTVNQQRIDNLPINGRNYIQFVLVNSQAARDVAPSIGAAPTSGLNIAGQRARSNLVNVDGADAVDNSVNGIRSTVSQEAVQEFQMITNGYAAEYGRASGGVVNIVTRGGTNMFHGTAYAYLRHRSIQADNPFTNVPNPAYTRVQTGFTLGGPIAKDRTFYFLSFETTRRQETGFSTIGIRNFDLVNIEASRFFGAPAGSVIIQGTAGQQAFLQNPATPVNVGTATYAALVGRSSGAALNGRWPTALGGNAAFATTSAPLPASFVPLNNTSGNYPVKEGTSIWGLRLDHKFTPGQQLMLRGNVSPSTVTGIQVNAQNQNFGQNAYSRTSQQQYRDASILAQHTALIGNNKVNEFRFQFARRGLRYDFSKGPGGSNVAINIPGYAFFGREPFSFVDRVEKRYQFTDNFTWATGNHSFKFGGDVNHIPLEAQFTVNFGGLFNFGGLGASSLGLPASFPAFSAVQAYGLGIPQVFVQGVGDPNARFTNNTFGGFVQDSWRIRPNLTLNYGVRYDFEATPTFAASSAIAQSAQAALGITEGIPRDKNNIAPRLGIAWDPWNDGKSVFRASYGMFYDHPLLALAFNSSVADGSQAPQIVLFGGTPTATCSPAGLNLNATNVFQGILNTSCLGGNFGYLPQQQRFDFNRTDLVFSNQNYLTAGVPLLVQPFGFPVSQNFEYAYSLQGNFTFEHQWTDNLSMNIGYSYNGGRHLNRPINVNPVNSELLIANWERAVAAGAVPPTTNPLSVATCGSGPAGVFAPAALLNFFRPSGTNPSLTAVFAPCAGAAAAVSAANGLGLGTIVPFSDAPTNFSNGSSVYHGLTANLKKRFSNKFEFLASYTWSHAIDDSTDLQSLLSPQDNRRPDLERSDSTFDQRHRFVFSSVYQSGDLGAGFFRRIFSNFTVAPIIEASSGRPFNILVGSDRNFDFGSNTDRPRTAAGGQTNLCGDVAVASVYSPTGFFIPACFIDGTFNGVASNPLTGDLRRNAGLRPMTIFTDIRVGRRFHLTDRVKLDGLVDVFNVINRFNVADVNPLFNQAGTPTAAFDPRQVQFGLKFSW